MINSFIQQTLTKHLLFARPGLGTGQIYSSEPIKYTGLAKTETNPLVTAHLEKEYINRKEKVYMESS